MRREPRPWSSSRGGGGGRLEEIQEFQLAVCQKEKPQLGTTGGGRVDVFELSKTGVFRVPGIFDPQSSTQPSDLGKQTH